MKLSKAKKAGNPINPAFSFWIGNRKNGEVKYFASDMRQVFKKWLKTKEKVWLLSLDTEMVVVVFITEAEGLNATYDKKELPEIVKYLKPDYKKYIQ